MNNWTRKDLKSRAKVSFKQNYWKCVLVALILALISGGIGASTGGNIGRIFSSQFVHHNYTYDDFDDFDDYDDYYDDEEFGDEDFYEDDYDEPIEYNDYDVDGVEDNDIEVDIDDLIDDYFDSWHSDFGPDGGAALGVVIGIFTVIALFFKAIGLAVSAFLLNPLTIGAQRFFYRNDRENADLDNLGFCFKNSYLNMVKIMFFRDLKLLGWTLLLIIPGVIKSYEYRMIPYILQDNPDMNSQEAFSLSKTMMMGNKWKAFVLDLSFIGWFLVAVLTGGIAGIFYVNPYYQQTSANLYAALKGDYQDGDQDASVRQDGTEEQFVEFEI